MCGILVDFQPEGMVDDALLRRGMDALRPRGPDGDGLWISADRTVGFGYVRLAILDLAGSPQPIASEDGSVVAVVNGEFHGHDTLRRDLVRRGHRFRTGGDSELAIHLHEEHGLAFVEHLRGEFAVVLWDQRRRQLVAVRDRFGIKPLCCHVEGNRLRIASQAKGLFAMGVAPAWDHGTAARVCGMQYMPPDRTLFAGVRQLRPGHLLVASTSGVATSPYWEPDCPAEAAKLVDVSLGELAESLRERLDEELGVYEGTREMDAARTEPIRT